MSLSQAEVHQHAYAFLRSCANALALCVEDELQQQMVSALSEQLAAKRHNNFKPNPLPVLYNKNWVKDMKLARDFREFAEYLPWQYSPRSADYGEEMAIMDFNDLFELDNLVTGLMYVDSEKAYPEHNHLPDEMYFLISGTGLWRFGGNENYQSVTAGNVIYNHPWNWHGVRAGQAPLLALYLQVVR